MTAPNEFQDYLQCIHSYYQRWWKHSVLTDIEREQSDPFDFDLRVKEVKPQPTRGSSSENSPDIEPPLPVIQALHQYIADKKHVFLVGQPGAGKTKTLLRYLLELVEQAKGDSSAKIPILVQLKDYKVPSDDYSGIVHLIRKDLEESWGLSLELAEIQRYLFQEQIFLLLVDGLNELSTSKEAWKDIRQFWDRCHKRQIYIVFTTRGLGYRNLGIETQLEIQSIAPKDRQRFLEERVLPGDRQKLQVWLDRARQSDYTPFVMWMLTTVCQQVNLSSQLESFSIGEAFREFVRLYQDRLYEEGRISDEDGEEWASRLENLASEMMSDERAENFVISRVTAIEIIGSEALLNNLIRHHLLVERRGKGEIGFCHQLLQEYYVAEWLRRNLPDFLKDENSGKRFQHDYLNYLKWTEPIALMLGLPEITETYATKIIELALDVDLMLGVRLAGEVKPQFQEQTIELVSVAKLFDEAEVSDWLQIELVGRTRFKLALPKLRQFLKNSNIDIARRAAAWIGFMGYQEAIPDLLQMLSELDRWIPQENGFQKLTDRTVSLEIEIIEALAKLSPKEAELKLHKLLDESSPYIYFWLQPKLGSLLSTIDPEFSAEWSLNLLENTRDPEQIRQASDLLCQVGYSDAPSQLIQKLHGEQNPQGYQAIIRTLGLFDTDEAVSALTNLIKSPDSSIRKQAAKTLIEHKRTNATNDLIIHLSNSDGNIRWCAAVVLANFTNNAAIPMLLEGLLDENRGIRITAAQLLGMFEKDEVISALCSSLKDPDYAVRRSAAISLANFNQQEAIPELLKALRHYYPSDDSSESVEIPFKVQEDFIVTIRGMTYETLNNLGDNEAIEAWLLERNSRSVREQVADALGKFNTEEVIQGLFSVLHKGFKAAAVPLGKLGKQEVVPELIELLHDPSQISSNNKVIDTLVSLASLCNLEIVSKLISILENINDYSHTDFYFKNRVAIVLAGVEHQAIASYLPNLVRLLPTEVGEQVSWAIDAIQFRYGFYNYEISQYSPPEFNITDKIENECIKPVNMTYNNFDQRGATIGVNVASEGSNIKFIQHAKQSINISEQDLAEAAQKIQDLLNQLAQTYPPISEPQQQTFIQKFLEQLESTPKLIKVILAGGIEGLKVLCPPAGIPVEMARCLYEVVQKHYGQP